MKDKIKIKKDGKTRELTMFESNGKVKFKAKGDGCKEIMGKDYFKEMEVDFPEF